MTSRERVIAAIEFGSPDRTPFTHAVFPGALWRHGERAIDLLRRFPDDFGNREFAIPPEPEVDIEEYVDEWGSVWRRAKGYTAGEVVRPALADWDAWPSFEVPPDPPPDDVPPPSERDWYALRGWYDLYERMQYSRGTPNVLMDLAEDKAEVHELADKLLARNLRLLEREVRGGMDGVWLSDDWGTQDRLLVNPLLWRAFFKPRYRPMIELLKDAGKHVFFHTCGWTVDIWDDLIELGVDALNCQVPLIPPEVVRERLTGKVCVFSDVDRQHAMPFGTPSDVRDHIHSIIATCGTPAGGVMLRGELEAVWPIENIEAMYEAFTS